MAGLGKGMFGPMRDRILEMLENPGLPQEVMDDARAQVLSSNRANTFQQLQRRAGQGSARALFDSGITQQGLQGIEAQGQNSLAMANTNLEMQNAMKALEAIQTAFGQMTDISNSNLRNKEANIQRRLGLASIALQEKLGMGGLNLQSQGMDMERAWQEFQMNLMAQNYYGNAPAGATAAPSYGSGGGSGGFGGGGFAI